MIAVDQRSTVMRALPDYSLADPAVAAFGVIPLALVTLLTWGVYRAGESATASRRAALVALACAVWLASTWLAAGRGVFLDFQRTPPPFAFLIVAVFAIAAAIAFSPLGWRLATSVPLWALIGVQSFRLPLELAMHEMGERGIMPTVMGYSGRNLDILTGLTALPVAALIWSGRAGSRLAAAWNVFGAILLGNIIVVAILATPRFQYFGPDQLNVWVLHPPFVWLPAVMVLAALAGHLLVVRALALTSAPSPAAGGVVRPPSS